MAMFVKIINVHAYDSAVPFLDSILQTYTFKNDIYWEFPGGQVVRTWGFPCRGPGSIPDWETKIPQATQHGQKKKKDVYSR